MSFLAILAPAWVPSEFNYRWSLPSDPLSDEGLGGGITWALDPSFCDTMLPSFHEDAPTTRYCTEPGVEGAQPGLEDVQLALEVRVRGAQGRRLVIVWVVHVHSPSGHQIVPALPTEKPASVAQTAPPHA